MAIHYCSLLPAAFFSPLDTAATTKEIARNPGRANTLLFLQEEQPSRTIIYAQFPSEAVVMVMHGNSVTVCVSLPVVSVSRGERQEQGFGFVWMHMQARRS